MASWLETLVIRNDLATVSALSPTKTTIYAPSNSAWAYSHHPFIDKYGSYFYVMYTNSPVGEADPGSRVVVRRSSDFSSWVDTKVIGPDLGNFSLKVYTAGGFMQFGGTLYAFYSETEYDPKVMVNGGRPNTDTGYLYTRMKYISTTDGVAWTAAKELGPNLVNNRPPRKVAGGRYIMTANVSMPYTDAADGLSGYFNAGLRPKDLVDDPSTFVISCQLQGLDDALCEVDIYQVSSGEIRALFRPAASPSLWVSRSLDNGETWSQPGMTGFKHNSSKFGTGKLSDGRYHLIGNPSVGVDRSVLSLWTSLDGDNFSSRYDIATAPYTVLYPGFAKGGSYAYPSIIEYNGNLYAVASQGKESISGYRFPTPT